MASETSDSILIAGGGIGGLAAALAIASDGRHVRLFERAAAFEEVGAGIQMGPNFLRALDRLGVRDDVLTSAWIPDALHVRDATTAEPLTSASYGDPFRRRFGAPYAVTHRADLLRSLLERCEAEPRIELNTGSPVVGVDDDADGVTLTLGDGRTARGAALVGADGLWSRVRDHVIGDGPPRPAGHIAYRAVLPSEDVPADLWSDDVNVWIGPRTHLVHYPLRKGKLFNLVAVFHSDRYTEGYDSTGDLDELWRHFDGECSQVTRLLDRIETWKYWVLCDREPVRGWSRGRVTLLGDAAHPMLQYVAQGAAMSVEDAVQIADELGRADGSADAIPAAFARYEDARVKRTARAQIMSRIYGTVFHAAGVTAELRNDMLKGYTDETHWSGMEWMYSVPAAS